MKFNAQIVKDNGEIILRPLYSSDAEQMRKMKQNTDYRVEVKVARNPRFHNKVMALFRMGYENQERYNNFDHYRQIIVMKAGFYDAVETDKDTVYFAHSLAYDKMSQDEIEEVFERVLDVITDELGSDRQDILTELNSFL